MARSLALIFILIAPSCFSQKKPKNLPIPPNCVWLYDNVAIDRTEIANIHWLEYLYYLKKDSTKEVYTKALPDTSVWMQYDPTGQRTRHYLTSAELRYYPVVGISYQQAIDYCNWRSTTVNEMLKKSKKKNLRLYEVTYSLPTEKEWELAAAGKLDPTLFPYGFESYFDKPNLKEIDFYIKQLSDSSRSFLESFTSYFNDYKRNGKEAIFNVVHTFPTGQQYGFLEPVAIYNIYKEKDLKLKHVTPNEIGVADMIGNVAELISEKGVAKGGSWAHELQSCQIKKRQNYIKPEAWLGFRCVCRVTRRD
jgi:formylglycine-generating enzyme required for sulfatase activity